MDPARHHGFAASGPVASGGASLNGRTRPISIRTAIGQVPDEKGRAIVLYRFFVGLSILQIAERLRMELDEVVSRYQSAIGHLRRTLGGRL
jgi:DNA-directed RNA polymerase specialized sigma24 family protein